MEGVGVRRIIGHGVAWLALLVLGCSAMVGEGVTFIVALLVVAAAYTAAEVGRS